MEGKKWWKSKMLNFNIWVPALTAFVTAMGFEIPEEVTIGILAIGNFILRFVTKEPVVK